MQNNLTTGNVLKNILVFSIPYFLAYFLQTLYGMADLFIIGQFEGVAATTAVSIGGQVMHMLTVMLVGLAMGTTVCIAQSVGAGDKKQIALNVGNSISLFMIVSIVLSVALVVFVKPIVMLMSTPLEAVPGTIDYLTVCFIGIPFITAYNIISSIFRGMGDSKSPMYFIAVACIANIVLDYIFIGFYKMGPAGAALGTTFSQTISVIIALVVILKRKMGVSLRKSDFKPRATTMGKILKIGIPISLQDGLIQIAFIVITVIANRRGLVDAAAVGIVEKFIGFVFLVPSSMLSAVSAICAQNIGAGKPQRAKEVLRYAIIITISFGVFVSLIVSINPQPIIRFFTADSEVVTAGSEYLRGYVWDCIFAGIHFSFSGYFCACEKSFISFIHNILAIVFIRIPGVYITSQLFPDTLFPMGLATGAGSILSVIICIVAFMIMENRQTTEKIST